MKLADLRFENPWVLWLLVLVALAGAYLYWRKKTHWDPSLRFSSGELFKDLPRSIFARFFWLPDALRLLALVGLVVALARPQLVAENDPDEAEGIDIVLALDTSCSMLAADFQPNDRMFVAKKSVSEFVLSRKNDRIGLVVFGGEAASWVPLTLDYSLLAKMIEEVEVGMIEDGTAIGNAIGTSLNRLRDSEAKSKVVVLLTDGDSNRGSISPRQAAQFAKELGVRVYTILIGRGGPVPFPAGKDLFGRKVYQQQVIPTNPKLLEEIAALSGGKAYTASDKEELDSGLGQVLDELQKTRIESNVELVAYAELFPHAVLAAFCFILLELGLRTTRMRRFP